MHLSVELHTSKKSYNKEKDHETIITGTPYIDNKKVTAQDFNEISNTKDFLAFIQKLNGFYSIIHKLPSITFAACDQIRSQPLFYIKNESKIIISDYYENLIKDNHHITSNEFSRAILCASSFTIQSDTLTNEIKQIEAGQLIAIDSNGAIESFNHYKFWHEDSITDTQYLKNELDRCFKTSIDRLIDFSNGRMIIVPLSGGYDSRLIVSELRLRNYDNVICFSYGKKGNKESEYSKSIASDLEYPWLFVEYTDDKWKNAWFSKESDSYLKLGCNGVSLPHVQDWLAIRELINKGLIPKDSVVVPGHSGDFVAGSHIPNNVFTEKKLKKTNLIDSIVYKHHSCSNSLNGTSHLIELKKRLNDFITTHDDTAESFANYYELWDWRERQAKYIANSIRVYDFYNLDWWMPLWDRQFISFWHNVPLNLRRDRKWFIQFINERYKTATRNFTPKQLGNAGDSIKTVSIIKKIIKSILPESIVLKSRRAASFQSRDNNPLSFGALIPKSKAAECIKLNTDLIGAFNKVFIDGSWQSKNRSSS